MKSLRPRLFPLLFSALAFLRPPAAHAQDNAAWEALFNGRDFEGWSLIDPPIKAIVRDDSMILRQTPHTARHAFIRTNQKYDDFIFEIEFRRDRRIDSGVLFRAERAPDTAFSALFGYMVKIDPKPDRRWTGGIFVDFGDSYGWLQTLAGDDRARAAEKPGGEWNRLRIEAIGQAIKVWLNGIPTAHLIDEKYSAGYLALKIHFLNNEGAALKNLELSYRNARIIARDAKKFSTPIDLPVKDTRGPVTITRFR